jgi:hypothetical protein
MGPRDQKKESSLQENLLVVYNFLRNWSVGTHCGRLIIVTFPNIITTNKNKHIFYPNRFNYYLYSYHLLYILLCIQVET